MEGLFADAYDPNGYRAGVYDTFVPWGGAWLAQELVQDGRSVREQVFQATLLEVVTETFATRQTAMSQAQQSALTAAVLELAKTYAWLNPNPETTVPTEGEAFGFLDLLWRLQVPDANGQFKNNGDITAALGQSVTQLGQLLEGVNDPVRAIQFINNLMRAASTVPSLKNDLKDAQFLREFIEFGFEFVSSNPTVNQTASDAAVQGFLDRLWRGDTQQVKQAQGGLSAFFAGMDTKAEKIKGLDFAVNLLNAAELLQGERLETQKKDPAFLDALIGLGGAYAASNPQPSVGVEDPQLFLNTLWKTQEIQRGSTELITFLEGVRNENDQVKLLQFGKDVLNQCRQNPDLQEQMYEDDFVNAVFMFGNDYSGLKVLNNSPTPIEEPYPFLNTLRYAQEDPAREIPGIMAEITIKAASGHAWAVCFAKYGVDLINRAINVAIFCTPPLQNVLPCLSAIGIFGLTLKQYSDCLKEFDDGNPSHKVASNDPTLLKIEQLVKRIEDWVHQRTAD
ncbi:hypothetical protein ACN4EK_31255 [Pantanalinema rosaneae CENA516]|uniref:hypothetical protein n=1 Tax=Pantanalinema rosaneae TaxID=1620701 RepID=UPI003D6F527E